MHARRTRGARGAQRVPVHAVQRHTETPPRPSRPCDRYERVYKTLLDDNDPDDARECINEDWLGDAPITSSAEGRLGLPAHKFKSSLFELADVYTSGISAMEYADFLWELYRAISEPPDGLLTLVPKAPAAKREESKLGFTTSISRGSMGGSTTNMFCNSGASLRDPETGEIRKGKKAPLLRQRGERKEAAVKIQAGARGKEATSHRARTTHAREPMRARGRQPGFVAHLHSARESGAPSALPSARHVLCSRACACSLSGAGR